MNTERKVYSIECRLVDDPEHCDAGFSSTVEIMEADFIARCVFRGWSDRRVKADGKLTGVCPWHSKKGKA